MCVRGQVASSVCEGGRLPAVYVRGQVASSVCEGAGDQQCM